MSPRKKSKPLESELFSALEDGDAKAVARLLEEGAPVDARNEFEQTPLMVATEHESPELAKLLLEHGADLHAEDGSGLTALLTAVRSRNAPVVSLLLERGADVHHACEDDAGNHALTLAVDPNELSGDPSKAVLEALLRAGADPNRPNANDWSPLQLAAGFEDAALTDVLLRGGADPRRGRGVGYLPIDIADNFGHEAVKKRLLAAGSPTLEQAAQARMDRLWKQLGDWFGRKCPPYADQLEHTRPATPAQLSALEKALSVELTPDLRAFLRRFGGGASNGNTPLHIFEYAVLSTKQIQDRWKGLDELRRGGTFEASMPHDLDDSQEEVKVTWWDSGWIPFAQDGGGNLYCVDLAPGPDGTRGQVIAWEMHGGPSVPWASSLDAFFEKYLEVIEGGRTHFDGETLTRDGRWPR